MSLIYKTIHTGRSRMNGRSYILVDSVTREAAVIDPDMNTPVILDELEKLNAKLSFILLTHGHFDHIGDVDILRELTGCPLYMQEMDAPMLAEPMLNVSGFENDEAITRRAPQRLLQDGDILPLGELNIQVLHTPGHSPGSTCYLCENVLFSGDTLMLRGIGRMDLPGGNMSQMRNSLKRLYALKGDIIVLGGHGEATTIAEEAARMGRLR